MGETERLVSVLCVFWAMKFKIVTRVATVAETGELRYSCLRTVRDDTGNAVFYTRSASG